MKKLELSILSAIVEMRDNESVVFFTAKVLKERGGHLREVRLDVPQWTSRTLTSKVKTE